jgi:hypothetical protein
VILRKDTADTFEDLMTCTFLNYLNNTLDENGALGFRKPSILGHIT